MRRMGRVCWSLKANLLACFGLCLRPVAFGLEFVNCVTHDSFVESMKRCPTCQLFELGVAEQQRVRLE